jgi:hypothetical protein
MTTLPAQSGAGLGGVFRSFWMGGYEGADHRNGLGVALDMANANGHAAAYADDYRAASRLGLRTLRESLGWRLCEPAPGGFDLRRLHAAESAARRTGVQLVWSLMHYGIPADLSFLDDRLIGRFAAYARAVATALKPLHETAPIYNLINEINFIAWAVSATSLVHPYVGAPEPTTACSGYAVKQRLVRAVLAAIAAVREVDPRARFLHIEPLVHVVAPRDAPHLQPLADDVRGFQWQAWDMIAGTEAPELGGYGDALDIVGVNHYHSGQWEAGTEERLWWHEGDERRRPLAALLADAWQRYRRPLIIAETGHVGDGRVAWLDEVAAQAAAACAAGVPLEGVCLYPLIDRPDWNDAGHWHRSGLWDIDPDARGGDFGVPPRHLHTGLAEALRRAQALLPQPSQATPSASSIEGRAADSIVPTGCARSLHGFGARCSSMAATAADLAAVWADRSSANQPSASPFNSGPGASAGIAENEPITFPSLPAEEWVSIEKPR